VAERGGSGLFSIITRKEKEKDPQSCPAWLIPFIAEYWGKDAGFAASERRSNNTAEEREVRSEERAATTTQTEKKKK